MKLLYTFLLFILTAFSVAQVNDTVLGSDLLDAFRNRYTRLAGSVQEAITGHADSVVLSRLGDDLDTFRSLVQEVCEHSYL